MIPVSKEGTEMMPLLVDWTLCVCLFIVVSAHPLPEKLWQDIRFPADLVWFERKLSSVFVRRDRRAKISPVSVCVGGTWSLDFLLELVTEIWD
jgi:hypothetical protein